MNLFTRIFQTSEYYELMDSTVYWRGINNNGPDVNIELYSVRSQGLEIGTTGDNTSFWAFDHQEGEMALDRGGEDTRPVQNPLLSLSYSPTNNWTLSLDSWKNVLGLKHSLSDSILLYFMLNMHMICPFEPPRFIIFVII